MSRDWLPKELRDDFVIVDLDSHQCLVPKEDQGLAPDDDRIRIIAILSKDVLSNEKAEAIVEAVTNRLIPSASGYLKTA